MEFKWLISKYKFKENFWRFFKTWKAGCPDITVLHDGQFIWLEVKNEKGKQSDNQKVAEERILKSWGKYYIVRSIQDVIDIL